MNNPIRTWLFRFYWLIVVVVIAVAIPLTIAESKPENRTGNVATICVGALGVFYFVQKQKLDELQIFERLFTRFNERYAEMNDELQSILAGTESDGTRMRDAFNAYFNLCGEEYLFYSHGRILPLVWQSWCRGMVVYLNDARIRVHWDAEMETGSYYGLTISIIERGAGRPLL
jgi:hypothetical protein